MLKITTSEIGSFPEVDRLNPRFVANSLRLKLCIDMTEPPSYYLESFPHLLYRLIESFPNLRRHDCSAGEEMNGFRGLQIAHHLLPIKIVGSVIDTAHLLEHLIIELQCSLAQMRMCSGITCGLWEPENRFDIFVECEKANVASFAGRLGVNIVNEVMRRGKMTSSQERMLRIAPMLLECPTLSSAHLARQLKWSTAIVSRSLSALRELEFPFEQEHTFASHKPAITRAL